MAEFPLFLNKVLWIARGCSEALFCKHIWQHIREKITNDLCKTSACRYHKFWCCGLGDADCGVACGAKAASAADGCLAEGNGSCRGGDCFLLFPFLPPGSGWSLYLHRIIEFILLRDETLKKNNLLAQHTVDVVYNFMRRWSFWIKMQMCSGSMNYIYVQNVLDKPCSISVSLMETFMP